MEIKKLFLFPYRGKDYVFAAIAIHSKVPPEVDPNTGFRVIRQEADDDVAIISVNCITHKVVLLKFSEHLTPGRRRRHDAMLALVNYK